MKKENCIEVLVKLGDLFRALGNEQEWKGFEIGLTAEEYASLEQLIGKVNIYNPWFTKDSVLFALRSLGTMLERGTLVPFAARYGTNVHPKRVAIIMAGNIPLVGFHDLMCVLLSGHRVVCKLSSSDARLLPAFLGVLQQWDPEIAAELEWTTGPIKNIDAVIATGSDNSANYFEQYFGKYPHIFRRNRTSVAVLNGQESPEEMIALGEDLFRYFGLGCRNVSKIFVPRDFNLDRIFEGIVNQGAVVNHHKYANNYDYNRTIYMMNSVPFLDNNFCILREDDGLFSPLSVFFVQRYDSMEEVHTYLAEHAEVIQTIVGAGFQALGQAQQPAINDYADGIDTMKWLVELP